MTKTLAGATGGRRSWPVDCYVQLPMKDVFEDLPGEVDQIWAEAVVLYKQGHPLILDDKAAKAALEQQRIHTEENPKTGMIIEYLDRLYPNNWEDMDLNERRAWLSGNDLTRLPKKPTGKIKPVHGNLVRTI